MGSARYSTSGRVKWTAELHNRATTSLRAASSYAAEGNDHARRRSLETAYRSAMDWAESIREAIDQVPASCKTAEVARG